MALHRVSSRVPGSLFSRQVVPLPRYLASSSSSTANTSSSSTVGSGVSSVSGTPGRRQSARDWFIVGASGSVAVAGAYWYLSVYSAKSAPSSSSHLQQRSFSLTPQARTQFKLSVPSADRGQREDKIIYSLLPEEVDARLRENERSTKVERPPGACIVEKYETNSLASNDPIEDRKAEVIVERDRAVEGVTTAQKGDLGFFAVMDGHAGFQTSTLLSNKVCNIAFSTSLELIFSRAS
jgi:pyruvate dehydrogenase phosphatase